MKKNLLVNVITNNKGILCTLVIGIVMPLVTHEPYVISILILYLLYAYLGQCWDLLGGYTGQISLGNAAFFGLGAYSSAILFNFYGISPWVGMWLGVLLAVGASIIIGYPCFRFGMRGIFFAFFTLAFNEALRTVISAGANAPALAFMGGPEGITIKLIPSGDWLTQIYNLQFFGRGRSIPYYYIFFGLLIMGLLILRLTEGSRFGYCLKAIKADESVAESVGINILKYKLYALALSSALTALAGTFYAFYIGHIEPGSFMGLNTTLHIILVPLIGGSGYIYGSLVGALVVIGISYLIKFCINPQYGPALTSFAFGLIMIVIVLCLREGIALKIIKLRHKFMRKRSLTKP